MFHTYPIGFVGTFLSISAKKSCREIDNIQSVARKTQIYLYFYDPDWWMLVKWSLAWTQANCCFRKLCFICQPENGLLNYKTLRPPPWGSFPLPAIFNYNHFPSLYYRGKYNFTAQEDYNGDIVPLLVIHTPLTSSFTGELTYLCATVHLLNYLY